MYKTIDLFAGIGGIRKGFEMTGHFKNVLSAEIDKYACQTYEHLYNEDPFNDVTSEEFKLKVELTPYDVLLAGFPCQSFSRAGQQKGFLDSTRGTLFFDIADIIKRTKPKAFLLENVDNLLSHDKGNTFNIILEVLINELNYKIIGVEKDFEGNLIYERSSFIRNTRNFGLPQNRPRVYIMGFDNDQFHSDMYLLSNEKIPSKRAEKDIFDDLHELLEYRESSSFYIAEGYLETLKKHRERHKGKGNGFGYIVVNKDGIEKPISNALLATGGSGKERNLVVDPQEGVGGLKIKNKKTPLNNEHIRHMTPTEWGKLQGFIGYAFVNSEGDDTFSFPPKLSNAQKYKQFGNSVSIPVIEEMAKYLYSTLELLTKRP